MSYCSRWKESKVAWKLYTANNPDLNAELGNKEINKTIDEILLWTIY